MLRSEVRQSAKMNLTSYSGLALIGQCLEAARVEAVIAPKLPVSQGMKTSDLVKSLVGLLTLGKRENAVSAQARSGAAAVKAAPAAGRSHNSGTKKEAVGRSYKGLDGYCAIAAYLGNEGWVLGLELRAGTWHSAFETQHFYQRIFPRARHLVSPPHPVPLTEDSGFDSAAAVCQG